MPHSAKRRCKCGNLVRGPCPTCQTKRERDRNETEHRRFALSVYKSKQWESIRKEVYIRDAATCADCGLLVQWEDYHADHIQPLRLAPERAFDATNVQCLHSGCHARKTKQGG